MKEIKRYNNFEILQGIQNHDKAVLNYIYSQFFEAVSWYVVSKGGDKSAAYDVFQDALMAIYDRLQTSSLEISNSFETYFSGMCKHLWHMELRRMVKTKQPIDISHEEAFFPTYMEETYDKEKESRMIQESFFKLSNDCQKLLMLQQQGHSQIEIAEIMDYTEAFTRKKRFRCKEQLAELVRNHPYFKKE